MPHPDENLPLPTLVGRSGRAWRYDLEAFYAKIGKTPGDSCVEMWLFECPEAHPVWHSYVLSLVHLRPVMINGVTLPTTLYLAGATHEIVLFALNPQEPRDVLSYPHVLNPKNFAAQFIADSDATAAERIEATVQLIVNGDLNPDTDALSAWIALFGDKMVNR